MALSRYVVGVDGGNTKTDVVVADCRGRMIGQFRGGSTDIYSGTDAALAELERVVRAALALAEVAPENCGAAVFSLAGADWPEDHQYLGDYLRKNVNLGTDPIVVNDSIGALRMATSRWEGVSIVCGTGNAVGARRADGKAFHLGFWPDPVGSVALGQAALDAVTRAHIDMGPQTSLTARAKALYGLGEVEELVYFFTRRNGAGRSDLVKMIGPLFEEANLGDGVARCLVVEAGRTLGRQARAAAQRIGLGLVGTPALMAGGMFRVPSDLLEISTMEQLPEAKGMRLMMPPVVGAVLAALDQIGVEVEASSVADTLAPNPEG